MEIATLIFILSFFAIVSVLVTSTIRYMCKKKDDVSKQVTSDRTLTLDITYPACKELNIPARTVPMTFNFGTAIDIWQKSLPHPSTRLKNRNKRKGKKK